MPDKTDMTYIMRAHKYDGRIHYEQELNFVGFENGVLTLAGEKGRKLKHYTRDAVYTFNERTLEYFFTDRWYTAALVFDDTGKVVHVYCNIALPAEITGNVVGFVDLDVDVIVKDGRIDVVDIDEFEEHSILFGYGQDIEKRVFETVELVKSNIINREFPFDREILSKV
jgi:protein associated with RNAse G/E